MGEKYIYWEFVCVYVTWEPRKRRKAWNRVDLFVASLDQ